MRKTLNLYLSYLKTSLVGMMTAAIIFPLYASVITDNLSPVLGVTIFTALLALTCFIILRFVKHNRVAGSQLTTSRNIKNSKSLPKANDLLDFSNQTGSQILENLNGLDLISDSISKVIHSRNEHSNNSRDRMPRWASYGAIFTSVLTFLFGVTFVKILHPFGISLANKLYTLGLLTQQGNQTIFEGIIALLNIALAIFVLVDLRFLRPIKTAGDSSPASSSFKQLLWGWELLWFTWILFYGCLTFQWLQLGGKTTSIYLWRVSDALNLINGFFFYYLFFVLDQPSVKTDKEPDRARSFRLNYAVTFFIGAVLFNMSGFIPMFIHSAKEQIVLVSQLVPAYIAVGMAFFFGRLDSHYLKLPRVILAPFYLYAVIQLFWEHDTFADVTNFNPERVAIFSLALVLKFVVFLTLSKLIRHESFRRYFVVAEQGLRDG